MMISTRLGIEDLALKARARLLVERVGGLDAAAACTRVGRSQFAAYQSPHHDQFMPADVIARLEEVAQEPLLTEELARRAGYALSRPQGDAAACISQALARLAKESADLHGAVALGLSDGQLCPADEAAIEREAMQVKRVVNDLLAGLWARRSLAQIRGPA